MKRIFVSLAALALAASAQAQTQDARQQDSLRVYHMQQIEVVATRANEKTPVAYSDITREEIVRNNYAQDIPFLLMLTPSVVATSETGNGIGGTSLRMRGTDATRLNVTANGVPLNNPDSHAMYWYDTPDFISSVGTVQVQRGAGTSTNGTGAFGGAVNMTTEALSTRFGGDASLSYGSYNTNKQAIHISSGLLGGHWLLDARLTHIGSNGYIDRGATDLKSYMFQAGYYSGNTMVKLLSFGGKAKTYLTYNGATKEEMELNGRRYNSSGMYTTSDGPHYVFDNYNNFPGPGQWTRVGYYDDQTDNYLQINNQLLVNHRFNDRWEMNLTAHYTYGYGYYKQYKDDAWLVGYDNLFEDGQSDLIREKIMRNHFGGLNASGHYTAGRVEVAFGGSWNYYTSPHWGELDWIQEAPDNFMPGMRWYDNSAKKQDANLFARINVEVAKGLNVYADMQYRYVGYKVEGTNDNYDWNQMNMQPLDIDKKYHFFNPRAGITYAPNKHNTLYASFAVAQKEPTRSDFTDRFTEELPSSEKLYDYELGYQFRKERFSAGVNLYYMKYKDQLVQSGLVNDSGDPLNINVADSYRRGIELTASWKAARWFTFGANATLSQNRIENYTDRLANSPTYDQNLGRMTISYSPNVIAGTIFDFHVRGFQALLHTQYVGKQYFTNDENDALSLDRYCVTNLNLNYTLQTRSQKSVRFGITVFNLFNTEYESNGYGLSAMQKVKDNNGNTVTDASGNPVYKRYEQAYYFAQAPLNVLANVTVNF